jgi:hypothetical protein
MKERPRGGGEGLGEQMKKGGKMNGKRRREREERDGNGGHTATSNPCPRDAELASWCTSCVIVALSADPQGAGYF